MANQKAFVIKSSTVGATPNGQQEQLNQALSSGWYVKEVHVTQENWLVIVQQSKNESDA